MYHVEPADEPAFLCSLTRVFTARTQQSIEVGEISDQALAHKPRCIYGHAHLDLR